MVIELQYNNKNLGSFIVSAIKNVLFYYSSRDSVSSYCFQCVCVCVNEAASVSADVYYSVDHHISCCEYFGTICSFICCAESAKHRDLSPVASLLVCDTGIAGLSDSSFIVLFLFHCSCADRLSPQIIMHSTEKPLSLQLNSSHS